MSERPIETPSQPEELPELEARMAYRFKDPALLATALTHRSFVNECEGERLQHNESLEFLGDSVLGFLVSSRIFQRFPDLNEGELSKIKAYLVSAANLFHLAERMHLGAHLKLSRGEDKTGGRKKRAILVDAFEAVIGAIYLDGGVEAASTFVDNQIGEFLEGLSPGRRAYGDFKSALQEQLHNLGHPEPEYRVVDEIGPDHHKIFVVQVLIGDRTVAEAYGTRKKEAQQAAARLALESLRDSESVESL